MSRPALLVFYSCYHILPITTEHKLFIVVLFSTMAIHLSPTHTNALSRQQFWVCLNMTNAFSIRHAKRNLLCCLNQSPPIQESFFFFFCEEEWALKCHSIIRKLITEISVYNTDRRKYVEQICEALSEVNFPKCNHTWVYCFHTNPFETVWICSWPVNFNKNFLVASIC